MKYLEYLRNYIIEQQIVECEKNKQLVDFEYTLRIDEYEDNQQLITDLAFDNLVDKEELVKAYDIAIKALEFQKDKKNQEALDLYHQIDSKGNVLLTNIIAFQVAYLNITDLTACHATLASYSPAQFMLGITVLDTNPTDENAIQLIELAADSNFAPALHLKGKWLLKNDKKLGVENIEKASSLGFAPAMLDLFYLQYSEGRKEEGLIWLERASDANWPLAVNALGRHYLMTGNKPLAIELFYKAAKMGYEETARALHSLELLAKEDSDATIRELAKNKLERLAREDCEGAKTKLEGLQSLPLAQFQRFLQLQQLQQLQRHQQFLTLQTQPFVAQTAQRNEPPTKKRKL